MPARTRSDAHSPTIATGSASAACAARQRRPGSPGRGRGRRRRGSLLGQGLAPPDRDDRGAEVPHLGPEVVEVVLARDLVAGRLEHAAEEVADERAAGVADVERPGGVGRDELHVDPPRVGAGTRPQAAGCARTVATRSSSAPSARRRLRKPGGATSRCRRPSPAGRRPRSARPRAPRRSAGAPSGTAGPASSPGSWPGRRAPGSPAARSRGPGARRRDRRAARRQPSHAPRRPRARRGHASGAVRTLRARVAGSRCLRGAKLAWGGGRPSRPAPRRIVADAHQGYRRPACGGTTTSPYRIGALVHRKVADGRTADAASGPRRSRSSRPRTRDRGGGASVADGELSDRTRGPLPDLRAHVLGPQLRLPAGTERPPGGQRRPGGDRGGRDLGRRCRSRPVLRPGEPRRPDGPRGPTGRRPAGASTHPTLSRRRGHGRRREARDGGGDPAGVAALAAAREHHARRPRPRAGAAGPHVRPLCRRPPGLRGERTGGDPRARGRHDLRGATAPPPGEPGQERHRTGDGPGPARVRLRATPGR